MPKNTRDRKTAKRARKAAVRIAMEQQYGMPSGSLRASAPPEPRPGFPSKVPGFFKKGGLQGVVYRNSSIGPGCRP